MIYWAIKSSKDRIIGETQSLKKKHAWGKFLGLYGPDDNASYGGKIREWEARGFDAVEVVLVEKPEDFLVVRDDSPLPDPLAQRIEHQPSKLNVAGSSPAGVAI